MASFSLRRTNITLLCIKICIYFLELLTKAKLVFFSPILFGCLIDHGASGDVKESVSVMEGHSVTLQTGVEINQQDRIRWYFNDTRIAQITGDLSKICTDVQCNEGTERFRDRLELDPQTGSLTIMNTTTTDSGVYKLLISSSSNIKVFDVTVTAVPDSGLSTAIMSAGVGGVVVLLGVAAAVIYCCCRRCKQAGNGIKKEGKTLSEKKILSHNQADKQTDVADGKAVDQIETSQTDDANGPSTD